MLKIFTSEHNFSSVDLETENCIQGPEKSKLNIFKNTGILKCELNIPISFER